jgi:hypothetical protein
MKQTKNFKTAILYSVLSTTVLTILLAYGCNKKNSREAGNNVTLTQTAKDYFTGLANEEKVTSSQPSVTSHPQSTKYRVTPLSKMSPSIIWDQATVHERSDMSYVIMPLKEVIKPFKNKNYEFFRNVIFYKQKTGKTNMIIVEVLSKKGESLGNDLQNIAITAFENKYFSRSESIGELNAYVIFYNENYVQDTSFQLQNGKWAPARVSFRSDLDITQ